MAQQNQSSDLFGKLAFGGVAAWALGYAYAWRETELFWAPMALMIIIAVALVETARRALTFAIKYTEQAIAKTPSTVKGTARWAAWKDFRRLVRRKSGPFFGLLNGKPLFLEYAVAALTVAPSGLGKTIKVAINQLCSIRTSMIVADYKGELAACCARLRRGMGQKVYSLNPSHRFTDQAGEPARYNPLVILLDDWLHSARDMIADARAMALQLCPEPTKLSENVFFRAASRKIITFALLVEVIEKGVEATLSSAYTLVANPAAFREAVYAALVSDALDGDLASMAQDFTEKFENGDPRQWASFLEGSLQALEIFSPSGRIAESVAACDFRFHDLKREKATVFVMSDATRHDVYMPWLGLINWCAITEMMRCEAGDQVTLLLDECTNYRVNDLPGHLTRLRGYGVRTHIIIQELEDFARVYGREGLEILLSQTEIQQFFGSRSQTTLELLSRRLGESTVKTSNYALGGCVSDGVKRSLGEDGRRLFTEDEIRTESGAILFAHANPPALTEPVSYASVWPWRRQVAGNPYHQGRKLKGRIRVWL